MDQNEKVTVSLHVNGKPVEDELDKLRAKLKDIKAEKDKAFLVGDTKQYRELGLELSRVEKQVERVEGGHRALNKTLQSMSTAKPKELRSAIRALNAELNDPAVERGSEQWKRVTEQIAAAKEELKKIAEESAAARDMDSAAVKFGKDWVGLTTIFSQVVSAFGSAQSAIQGYIDDYAAMEEEMAGVRKYTGLSSEAVRELNEDFKRMDTRTARERLNQLAGDAGRLGITSKQEILEFVEAADMINVALGEDLGEDAVKNIGKLADVFGDKDRMGLKQAMLATGSAINELAQSSSASEPYILDFTARLAATGKTAGLTQAQIMGLASGFDQSKMDCEKAATALTKVFTKLMQDPAKAARVAGLEVQEFTRLVRTDANAALLAFAQGLSRFDKIGMTQALTELAVTGAGVSDALKLLATDTDRFREAQQQAAEAFREGTSVQKEFDVQNNTVQAGLDKARKQLHDVSVELGERLMPAASGLLGVSGSFVQLLSTLVTFGASHLRTVAALTASVALLTVAQQAATLQTKALVAAKVLWRGATLALQAALAPLRLVVAGVSKAVSLAATALKAHTVATRAATLATEQFNKATKKNIVGLALAALATAIAYWWDYADAQKAAAEAQGENLEKMTALQRVQKKAADSTQAEITRINRLTEIVNSNAYSYDTKKRALQALERLVPGFHANLGKELSLTKENTQAIQDYIRQLENKAKAEAYYEEMVELEKKLAAARRVQARKNFNVEAVNAEMERNPEKYKSQRSLRTHFNGPGSSTVEEYEGNEDRVKKIQELTKQQEAAANATREVTKAERELAELRRQLSADKEVSTMFDQLVITPTTPAGTGDGGGGGGYTGGANDDKRRAAARLRQKELEVEHRREQEALAAQFAAGEVETWEQYSEQLYQIDLRAIERRRQLWRQGDSELSDLDREQLELEKKHRQDMAAWSLRQIDVEFENEKSQADARAIRENLSEEEHQAELDRITLRHLQRRRDFLRDPANQASPADVRAASEALAAEEARQRHDREAQLLQQLRQMRSEYLKLSAADRMKMEEGTLEALKEKALVNEETYQQLLRQIRLKYYGADGQGGEIGAERSEGAKRALEMAGYGKDSGAKKGTAAGGGEWGGAFVGVVNAVTDIYQAEQTYRRLKELRDQDQISVAEYNAACAQLDQERFARLVAVAQAAYAAVSAVMNSASQLMQANASLEEARITERYDREIEAAGDNTTRTQQLEKEKQKELAKVKNKYNRKAMAVEIAQAVAQTAMNALMAYGAMVKIPVVGPALAVAAAAAATAAGMIQVAAIKKQHEAQAAGYYYGGFTGGTDYRRTAGVVHQGEFVANRLAVKNPNVLPVLQLIDRAQKNNTVASLTAADVSRAIGAPAPAASPSETAPASLVAAPAAGPDIAPTLSRLTDRLEQGIAAYVVIDGPDGLHRQYTKYQRLLGNK